jgi:hypothetical protein
LGRRYFSTVDTLTAPLNPAGLLETMMVIDLTLSAGVFLSCVWRHSRTHLAPESGKRGVVGISLCWSVCFYVLIASGDMRLIFPFAALLLFTALISLYFDPKCC